MKFQVLVAALVASFTFAAPADAATKKGKRVVHRASHGVVHSKPQVSSHEVHVSGELVGRDPDPNIRAFMMRNPHIWDGPE
jgi:hypothetical protein